jgi:molybdopterin-guanine dinucleotide biosynthesis protein A
MTIGAILLAGGRGSRVDGAVKPLFDVGGRTLLGAAVAAVTAAAASPVTVAGDLLDESLDVQWIREDPPFGGPAAAIVAVLDSWAAAGVAPDWAFVLACDLPEIDEAVVRLVADLPLLPSDADGMCLADATSRPQWLTGVYRTRALQDAASALPDRGADAPVRALVDDLAITVVRADHLTHDVDTWEDLAEARARAAMPHGARPTPNHAPHDTEETS